jgi:protein-S-isoprenylcysteine O-methyltransferase Ste14
MQREKLSLQGVGTMQKTTMVHRIGARILEVAILVVLPIMAHYSIPIRIVVPSSYSDLGFTIMMGGLALMTWVTMLFGRARSCDGQPVLITSGPFRFSRNPMYLGKLIWGLGLAVMFGSLIVFLFPILFFVFANSSIVPREERRLEQMMGEEYIQYRQRVRRWL